MTTSQEEIIILVDEKDNPIGEMEKMAAHRAGQLHRAFSVFIFNTEGQVMLQKRASTKYHSGGLWTNTCCSHPRVGETTIEAAHRRLKEEMGFDTDLTEAFSFIYKVPLDHELTEHEFDHVFVGTYNGVPVLNPVEAEDHAWVSLDALAAGIEKSPEKYTYWLKVCFDKLRQHRSSVKRA